MVIKRGGPGGPRVPPRPTGERAPTGTGRAAEPRRADELRAASAYDADAFDDDSSVQRSSPGDRAEDLFRADDAFRSETRSSAVRNTERLLETTYERLAVEYAKIHAEAHAIAADVAARGFSGDALSDAGPELRQQRTRMGKVRARLANIRRRLRTISLPAGTASDLQLEQRAGGQLRALAELERGVERTLMALQLATTFRPRGADGAPAAVLRLNVEGARDRAALGGELARSAPDATATQTMIRLLTGEDAPALADATAPTSPDDGKSGKPSDVRSLRAFALAQLST